VNAIPVGRDLFVKKMLTNVIKTFAKTTHHVEIQLVLSHAFVQTGSKEMNAKRM
jgi:hypothetical protein